MNEKTLQKVVMAVVAVILVLFFTMGVFGNPSCDIDAVFLGCRFHPFTAGDLIGTILFTAFALYIGGFLKLLKFDPWGAGALWNYIAFAVGILGIILIWNT